MADHPDFFDELEGAARSGDPETSHAAAAMPKGTLALEVLTYLARIGRPVTQIECERFYRDTKRRHGPRFVQLEDAELIERVRRPDGKVMTVKLERTHRELWRINDNGRAFLHDPLAVLAARLIALLVTLARWPAHL
jgi:DNA-binding transcriptional ArsR family regulator